MKTRTLTCLSLLAALTTAAAQSNHSQLFFDSSGTDQAAYGPDQTITVSGNLTYYGRSGPRPAAGFALDFVQPASDVYIMRHGYYHGGGAPGLSLLLTDVSGVPNTILGYGGGGFWEEVIATTWPQGTLKSGEYDVIIDEHQNGRFETAFDLYLGVGSPAILVEIPANVAGLPGAGIAAMKEKAREQYLATYSMQSAFKGVEYAYGVVATTGRPGALGIVFSAFQTYFLRQPQSFTGNFGSSYYPFAAARTALAAKLKHNLGLMADPPDPEFAGPVLLTPLTATPVSNADATAAAQVAAALASEGRLEEALLAAMEKYEGARAARNPRWALVHAREIRHFATLLAAELTRQAPAYTAARTQALSWGPAVEAAALSEQASRARVETTGFSAEEQQLLADLGFSGAEVGAIKSAWLEEDSHATRAGWLAALDAKIAAAGTGPAGMSALAAAMGPVITSLLAEPSIDLGDPELSLTVPASVTAGTPVTLQATGTNTYGGIIDYSWDANADGVFDITGMSPAVTFPASGRHWVGVRATNAEGRTAYAWAPVTVVSTNQPPSFTALTPAGGAGTVAVGATLNFTATATDAESGPPGLAWSVNETASGTGGSFAFTPTAAQRGLVSITVTAQDAAGATVSHGWVIAVSQSTPVADLSVTMEAPETPGATDAEFTWTMTVENRGPSAAANVVLIQTLPAGLTFVRASTSFGTSGGGGSQVSANFDTLAAGGLATVWVQTTAAAAGSYSSGVSVRSDAADFEIANNSASARVRVNEPSPQSADVRLTAAVAPSPATVSGTQTMTFTTANAGPDAASGLVLETQLPESVDFVSSTPAALSSDDGLVRIALLDVANGANTVATVIVRPSQAGSGPAYAQVYAAQGDPVVSNNQTQVLLTAVLVPPPTSDLAVTQTAPASARAGLPATWTITVTNHGPDAAENVSLSDVLPAGSQFVSAVPAPASLAAGRASFSLGTLANGSSRIVSLTVEPLYAGEAVNRVTATSGSRDANGAESLSTVNVQTAPTTSANLSATLSASAPTVLLNGQVTLTLTLSNAGPDAATAVRAVTRLPDGLAFVSASGGATHSAGAVTATVPALASGAQSVFTITAAAQAARAFVVVGEAHSEDLDPVAANNRATAAVTAQNAPPQPVDLAVSQAARSSVTLGDAVKITLTVTNRGPGTATAATLTETLPPGLGFASATSDQGTVAHNAGVVTASLGALAANESARIELTLSALAVGQARLAAAISSAETELAPADNASALALDIVPASPVKLKATYRFDDTLAACEPEAPPLVAIDPANADVFATEDVHGRTRRVYRWNGSPNPASAQAGLKLNTAGLLPQDNYTVEMLFRFTEDNGAYRSILHTGNRVGDQSLYVHPSDTIMVYPLSTGPTPFVTGTFHHVTLTVAPDGTVTTWLDGILQTTESTGLVNISDADLLHFFVDNDQGPAQSEYVDGEIALLRVYEGVLSPNRIASQAAYPFGPAEPMDANAQFSVDSNPAGVWAYGYSTTRGTPFLYDLIKEAGAFGGLLDLWSGTDGGPYIFKNRTQSMASYASILQPPDLLNLDPSYDGRNAVLRWTAPAGGTYRVQGRFQGVDVAPNGTDVAVLKNGDTETTLFEDYVAGFEMRKPFAVTVTLAMGETVDFSVGIGGNSNYNDSTGVDAVVTPLILTDDCADGTDLAVLHTPPGDVIVPGEAFTLDLTVTNAGLRPAPGVVLTSPVPAGLTFVSAAGGTATLTGATVNVSLGMLAPGETRSVALVFQANAAGTFTHTAQVTGGSFDPMPGNNMSSTQITAGAVIPLSATVRTTVDSITAGNEATFELVMANAGTLSAPGATLRPAMPAGTVFVSATGGGVLENGTVVFPSRTLAAGEVAGYSLRLRADAPGTITLTAVATSSHPSVRDATGSATLAVIQVPYPPPHLQVAISTDPPAIHAGCRVTITYTVTNTSPSPAASVQLSGLVPETLVVISTTASQGTATVTDGRLAAALGTVRQGTPAVIAVQALATAAEPTALGASVSGGAFSTTGLKHLWDFNEPAGPASSATVLTDRAGGAHGTVRGAGATTTGTGVELPGGDQSSAAYIDLPNNLISPLRQVTFEGWLAVNALDTQWGYVFSFGSSEPGGASGEIFGPGNDNGGGEQGLDYIVLTTSMEGNAQSQRFAVRNADPDGTGVPEFSGDSDSTTVVGQPIHFAVTVDNATPGLMTLRYYRDGVFKGELADLPLNLSDLNDVNNWLGRGNWTGFPHVPATFDEFRLYDRALTAAEIEASRLAGPNALTAAATAGPGGLAGFSTTASALIRRNIAVPPPGSPCATPVALLIFPAPAQQSYRLEWTATPGRKFLIQSSPDLRRWINVPSLYTAALTNETWTDPGPPATETAPTLDPERFYRVLELAE